MEKPANKDVRVRAVAWMLLWALLLISIIVLLLLIKWATYERDASAKSRQSLSAVSGKISKLEKDIETCLATNKETKEMMRVIKETPCEKPKKKVVRRAVRKPLALPPAKQVQVFTPPAPVLVPATVARPTFVETKPVIQEAPPPVAEARLLEGVDPNFGRTEEYVLPPTTVVQEEAPPRRVVRSSRVIIREQPSLQYYDEGYNAGYVQSYPQQYQSYPQQQYAPAPIYVPPYVPPPRQVFHPAPHVIVPAPSSHVVHPGGQRPSGVTQGHSPSGSTGGAR